MLTQTDRAEFEIVPQPTDISASAQQFKERVGLESLIGESSSFMAVVEKLPRIARSDATVFIGGETGTGKEVIARAIHHLSPRSEEPFVPVNCGAIPAELVENELFGHEKAAYTGASSSQHGLIREAQGGTLLLDEIDSLPPSAQVKLLRFLQEREYRPLGSPRTRTADVRLIAATNINVEQAIEEGRLRQDLYYRLNVLPLELPPLRERAEDIPLLAQHFLSLYAARAKEYAPHLSAEALQVLLHHDWPGNVRELEHVIERALILADGREIHRSDLSLGGFNSPAADTSPESFKQAKAKAVAKFECAYIKSMLVAYHGNISRAAAAARKNRRAFFELIRKHQIDASSFRAQAM